MHSLEKRLQVRPLHLARLQKLCDEGLLFVAGPFPAADNPDPGSKGFTGTLVIAEFPDLETAEAWAFEDPYYLEEVFEKIEVRPFKKVMP